MSRSGALGWMAGSLGLLAFGACGPSSPPSATIDAGEVPAPGTVPGSKSATGPSTTTRRVFLEEAPAARARIAELRRRFLLRADESPRTSCGPRPTQDPISVLGKGVATAFESDGGVSVQALIPLEATRGGHAALVGLPLRASGHARLEDARSHTSVRFALRDAQDVPVAVADGFALYAGVFPGADLVHRVHPEGSEDFLVFDSKPAREELAYDVDVSRVAGLRLVSETLEFLDHQGTPRLRVTPPYTVDAEGKQRSASLSIVGCAYDTQQAGPWGRPVTPPGAATCDLRVGWSGIAYPALIDPQWTTTGSLVNARKDHIARVLASGQVLVAGGYGFAAKDSSELYDPISGTFSATGRMTVPRQFHMASLLRSGKVLVAGGQTVGGDHLSSAEIYDPVRGTFTATGPMTTVRAGGAALVLQSGLVLFVGGEDGRGAVHPSAEIYDPGSETFTLTGSMAGPRSYHTASLLGSGKVLVAGGLERSTVLLSAELYNPTDGTFAQTGSMATRRRLHTASVLDSGKVLVAGGMGAGTSHLSSAEIYDPVTGNFLPTGTMTTPRRAHTASVLGSGKVLLVGGYTFTNLSSAELYDPVTGSFAATGSMATARGYHTARVLESGNVLVAGGWRSDLGSLSSAELLFTAAGGACTTGEDCGSGTCKKGICCATACNSACNTCAPGSGACISDPGVCPGNSTCHASGECKLNTGQACQSASACLSGHCADGYCCDTACKGGCDRCNIQPGSCTPAKRGEPGADPSCSPYVCDGNTTACPTSCSRSSDCVAGSICNTSTRTCDASGPYVAPPPSSPAAAPPAAPPAAGLLGGGGCAVSAPFSPSPPPPWALLGLAALFARRARRRS